MNDYNYSYYLKIENLEEHQGRDGYPYIFLPDRIRILFGGYMIYTGRNLLWILGSFFNDEKIKIQRGYELSYDEFLMNTSFYLNENIRSDSYINKQLDLIKAERESFFLSELHKISNICDDVGRVIMSFEGKVYPRWEMNRKLVPYIGMRSKYLACERDVAIDREQKDDLIFYNMRKEEIDNMTDNMILYSQVYVGFFRDGILVDPKYTIEDLQPVHKICDVASIEKNGKIFRINLRELKPIGIVLKSKSYAITMIYERAKYSIEMDTYCEEVFPDLNIDEEEEEGMRLKEDNDEC